MSFPYRLLLHGRCHMAVEVLGDQHSGGVAALLIQQAPYGRAQATAALTTYREAVEFAARCEAVFQALPCVVVAGPG